MFSMSKAVCIETALAPPGATTEERQAFGWLVKHLRNDLEYSEFPSFRIFPRFLLPEHPNKPKWFRFLQGVSLPAVLSPSFGRSKVRWICVSWCFIVWSWSWRDSATKAVCSAATATYLVEEFKRQWVSWVLINSPHIIGWIWNILKHWLWFRHISTMYSFVVWPCLATVRDRSDRVSTCFHICNSLHSGGVVELVGPDHRFERHHRVDFAVVGLGPFAPASFWAQGPTLIAAGTAGAGTDAWIKVDQGIRNCETEVGTWVWINTH